MQQFDIKNSKRIVIKVGSALVADADSGSVRRRWMASLADDIAELHNEGGKEIILVTSGAVALGRKVLGGRGQGARSSCCSYSGNCTLEEKQAAAACGQIFLLQAWQGALSRHDISIAQILLTLDDSENRRRYLNARSTLETLLSYAVVPVVNENDTVATAELRVGDNDRLAARVAQMAGADLLILLSDIDGLYTDDPRVNSEARLVPRVEAIDDKIRKMAGSGGSRFGTGGMVTKLEAAEIAMNASCHMLIARGDIDRPISNIIDGGSHTWFVAKESSTKARKDWIVGSLNPLGVLTIDDGAKRALHRGKSLLPAGVIKVVGKFQRGDAVSIVDSSGRAIAKGLSAYSSDDAIKIIGHNSKDIAEILGYKGRDALVHRDNMVMVASQED